MKEMGDTHWWEPNVGATNAVVLQSSGRVSLQQWSIQRHWQLRLLVEFYGGRYYKRLFRYLNYYSNGDVYRDNSVRLSVSVRCLRDSLWPLTL
jgi:hypothetical protein